MASHRAVFVAQVIYRCLQRAPHDKQSGLPFHRAHCKPLSWHLFQLNKHKLVKFLQFRKTAIVFVSPVCVGPNQSVLALTSLFLTLHLRRSTARRAVSQTMTLQLSHRAPKAPTRPRALPTIVLQETTAAMTGIQRCLSLPSTNVIRSFS